MFQGFPPETLAFLRGIKDNNNERWFEAHRKDHEAFYVAPAIELVKALAEPITKHVSSTVHVEPRVNGSVVKIARETYRSRDKRPYLEHLELWFWDGESRNKEARSYHLELTSNRLILSAGWRQIPPPQLAQYRSAVRDEEASFKALDRVLAQLSKAGYELCGKPRFRPLRGTKKDHPRAELLRYEALLAKLDIRHPPELRTARFPDFVVKHFKKMRPLCQWIDEHVIHAYPDLSEVNLDDLDSPLARKLIPPDAPIFAMYEEEKRLRAEAEAAAAAAAKRARRPPRSR